MAFEAQVVGLGVVGGGEFQALADKFGREKVIGVDKDRARRNQFHARGYRVSDKLSPAKATVIAVYTTEQVLEVVKNLPIADNPLIVIASTVKPGTHRKIAKIMDAQGGPYGLVLFPHRLDPEEPQHSHFNIDRVIGADSPSSLWRAVELYSSIMDKKQIHAFPIEIAELCKTIENTYRFLLIAFAEDLKMACQHVRVDFAKLRQAVNTKWNTEILEARRGIGGTCLPKDTAIISRYMGDLNTISAAIDADRRYKGFSKRFFGTNKILILAPLIAFTLFVVFNLTGRIYSHAVITPLHEVVFSSLDDIRRISALDFSDEQKRRLINERADSVESMVKELSRSGKISSALFYGSMMGWFK